jgi:hypothetical protein
MGACVYKIDDDSTDPTNVPPEIVTDAMIGA